MRSSSTWRARCFTRTEPARPAGNGRLAVKIRETAEAFTIRLYDGREFALRRYTAEEHSHALQAAAAETIVLPPFLLESCAVGPVITALDLADMTGAEVAEIHDLCVEESLFRRAARGLSAKVRSRPQPKSAGRCCYRQSDRPYALSSCYVRCVRRYSESGPCLARAASETRRGWRGSHASVLRRASSRRWR
jgi:hypothetical protein